MKHLHDRSVGRTKHITQPRVSTEMKTICLLLLMLMTLFIPLARPVHAAEPPKRMNVLVLICDDMNSLMLGDANRTSTAVRNR